LDNLPGKRHLQPLHGVLHPTSGMRFGRRSVFWFLSRSPQCFYYPFQLRDSVMGPTQISLTVFTVQMAMKYRLGSVISQLDQGYKIRNALLVSPVVGIVVSAQPIAVLPPSVALHMSTRISCSTRKKMTTIISTMTKRKKTLPVLPYQGNARKRLRTRRWVVSQTGMTFGPR